MGEFCWLTMTFGGVQSAVGFIATNRKRDDEHSLRFAECEHGTL